MAKSWSPDSWRGLPILQVPHYEDIPALEKAEAELASFPPLVFAGEVRKLTAELGEVALGVAFCFKVEIVQRVLQSIALIMFAIFSKCFCRCQSS